MINIFKDICDIAVAREKIGWFHLMQFQQAGHHYLQIRQERPLQ